MPVITIRYPEKRESTLTDEKIIYQIQYQLKESKHTGKVGIVCATTALEAASIQRKKSQRKKTPSGKVLTQLACASALAN